MKTIITLSGGGGSEGSSCSRNSSSCGSGSRDDSDGGGTDNVLLGSGGCCYAPLLLNSSSSTSSSSSDSSSSPTGSNQSQSDSTNGDRGGGGNERSKSQTQTTVATSVAIMQRQQLVRAAEAEPDDADTMSDDTIDKREATEEGPGAEKSCGEAKSVAEGICRRRRISRSDDGSDEADAYADTDSDRAAALHQTPPTAPIQRGQRAGDWPPSLMRMPTASSNPGNRRIHDGLAATATAPIASSSGPSMLCCQRCMLLSRDLSLGRTQLAYFDAFNARLQVWFGIVSSSSGAS